MQKTLLKIENLFLFLQTYAAGCVTHLLRANCEQGVWVRQLDDVWVGIVEDLAGDPLNEHQRTQCFLGGLGLTSAVDTAPLGFLASWGFVLPEVGACLRRPLWLGSRPNTARGR